MRGAGVYGASADAVLMLRRSQTEESKRILKPTKLRHASDVNREPRLLSLDPGSLWFRDEGPADEDEHILHGGPPAIEIDFQTLFLDGEKHSLQDVYTAFPNVSPATLRRRIVDAMQAGRIKKAGHGGYILANPLAGMGA
jgi:hypothetical protein